MSQPAEQTELQPKRFQCRHIHAEGLRCGSPCLRTTRQPLSKSEAQDRRGRQATFDRPLPEDRAAIQRSIGEVLRRIASHGIDPRRAGLLLYGLQIAALNLPKPPAARPEPRSNHRYRGRTQTHDETPETIEDIVLDPTHGILAPEAELVEKEEELSLAGQLLREVDGTADDLPQEIVIPTLNASDSRPTPLSKPRLHQTACFTRSRTLTPQSASNHRSTQRMTNRLNRTNPALAALLLSTSLLAAETHPPSDHLDQVLHQMDEASARFKSAEADLKKESYERVVKDTTTETGSVFFLRKGTATEMGLKMNPPNARFVEYKNGVGRIFDPGANHLTEARSAQYESFLTLGFGGRGSDLKKSWDITDQGTEQLTDGAEKVTVEKLDLVAKDPAARNTFSHITMWVDPTRGVLLKQVFFSPSGDIYTSTYTHIRYNQKVETAAYTLKTNKSTTVDRR